MDNDFHADVNQLQIKLESQNAVEAMDTEDGMVTIHLTPLIRRQNFLVLSLIYFLFPLLIQHRNEYFIDN